MHKNEHPKSIIFDTFGMHINGHLQRRKAGKRWNSVFSTFPCLLLAKEARKSEKQLWMEGLAEAG